MKKAVILLLVVFTTFSFQTVSAQAIFYPEQNTGTFYGAFGMTVIDNQSYITINLVPDIALGKFGIGLNINLLYNTSNGAIRPADWDENYDWFRLIRYLRYGRKGDNFYTKIGTLDAARIGHGFLMNYYTNAASYDQRKIGLALDVDFGTWGFESMTSNLGRLEIIGGRAYIRPLRNMLNIPIIKNLAFGATFITDTDPDHSRDTDDNFNAFGLDVELPLINFEMFRTYTYFDWAKLDTFGTGMAFGIAADWHIFPGIAEVTAKLERRMLGKEFVPSYFDAFYEVQRYEEGTGYRKSNSLALVQEETKGVFGELAGHILNTIHLVGNYQRLDDTPNSGALHLAAETAENIPFIQLQATYDKIGVEKFSDLFVLNDQSIARIGIGYKIKPYLIMFLDYFYTFQYDQETGKYKAQERFSPRLAFAYNFGL